MAYTFLFWVFRDLGSQGLKGYISDQISLLSNLASLYVSHINFFSVTACTYDIHIKYELLMNQITFYRCMLTFAIFFLVVCVSLLSTSKWIAYQFILLITHCLLVRIPSMTYISLKPSLLLENDFLMVARKSLWSEGISFLSSCPVPISCSFCLLTMPTLSH